MKILNIKDLSISLYNGLVSQARNDGGVFLPNPIFTKSPKYILIGMEPSIKIKNIQALNTNEDLFNKGRINFLNSEEDIILHYCAYKYLCNNKFDYYITDLSKVPIYTKDAGIEREERYKRWFDVLKEELNLFGYLQPNVKLISIGKTVDKFLKENNIEPNLSILHYSWSNSKHIRDYFTKERLNYNVFDKHLLDMQDFMNDIYTENNIYKMDEKRNRNFKKVGEWKKMLYSIYKYEFEKLASKN